MEHLDEKTIKDILEHKPQQVICLDSLFGKNDPLQKPHKHRRVEVLKVFFEVQAKADRFVVFNKKPADLTRTLVMGRFDVR